MRKNYFGLIFIFFLFVVGGCSLIREVTVKTYKESSSGLKYRILETGDGTIPQKGDKLTIHYIAKIKDGDEFDNTYKRDDPLTFRIGEGHVIEGWEEGLKLMSQGGKAEFVIPPELAYGEKGLDEVAPNTTVVFEIELLNIQKPEEPFEPDPEVFNSTPEGVKYVINEHGNRENIQEGSLVKVHYKGYFENGQVFDRSDENDKPIEFLVGEGMVIKGLDIGLKELKEGDKATLWIPYELAYGETGRNPIPPKTNIMFDIEILETQKPIQPQPFNTEGKDTLKTISGLEYIVVEEGSGNKPKPGDVVVVHYTGYYPDREIFDSSVKRDQPFKFVVGSQQVIPAWEEAIRLMKKGSKFHLIVPSELINTTKIDENIAGLSHLIFDIELINIKN